MSDRQMVRYYTPDPAIGLFGGRWVPTGRGTVRWVQERQPDPMPAEEPSAVKYDLCQLCGEFFQVSRHYIRYCSKDCSTEAHRRQRNKSKRPMTGKCADCGTKVDRSAKRCRPCYVALVVANKEPSGQFGRTSDAA